MGRGWCADKILTDMKKLETFKEAQPTLAFTLSLTWTSMINNTVIIANVVVVVVVLILLVLLIPLTISNSP